MHALLKKWSALFLAICVLLTTAACAQDTPSQNGTSVPDTSSGGASPAGAPEESSPETGGATLQLILPSNSTPFPDDMTENDNFLVDYWREKTGFDFDIVILPNVNPEEKLNLMFSGGEVHGMVFEKDFTAPSRYYNQGMLQPFDDYIDGSYFFDTFEKYQGKGQIDGQQFAAIIPPDGIPCASGLYIVRKDTLNSIGITEQPGTMEEFTQMLRDIKKQTDMVPLGVFDAPSKDSWDMIAAFFGMAQTHNAWAVRDGQVVLRHVQPEAYDYLVYCKTLYDEGLIPQDFLSLTADTLDQIYLGGQAATMIHDGVWRMPTFMPASEENGFDSRFMDYPSGAYGQPSKGHADRFFSQNIFLSNQAQNPGDYVKLLDFLALPETIKVNNYGLEGEHYTEDADGNMTLTEAGEGLQWAVYYRNIFLPEDWYSVYGVNANWAEYYYPSERHSTGITDFDPVEFMPQRAEDVALQSELKETIIDQFFAQAVTGEAELTPESFDGMVQQWMDGGGQAMQEYYTEQYTALGSPDYSNMYVSYLPEEHPAYTGKYLWDGHE